MPASPSLDQVKELLADGQTEAAADLLLQLTKDFHPEHFGSALLLKNRLETLQQNVIEGVISQSDENLEWARVSKGVVNLVTQIERGERPVPAEELLPPKPAGTKPAFSKKILWAIPLLLVLGIAVPKFLAKKNVLPPEKKETRINWIKYTGQVVRRNGEPAPNVRLLFKKGDLIKETYADANGNFIVELPEKLATVSLEIYFKEKLVMPPRNISVNHKVLNLLKIPD